MIRRTALRASAALALGCGIWLATTAGQARAAENPASVESAWWDTATPVAVPSPTTGSGQLQVGEGVNGPLSFAAVRFELPAGIDPQSATAVLSLDISQTGNVGTPAVTACVTTSSWTAGDDQQASSAPSYSCGGGRESVGVVSASGTSESWSLGPPFTVASGGPVTYNVALVPDPGSSTPFSTEYSKPTTSSVAIAGSPSPAPAQGAPAGPPDTGFGVATPTPAANFPVDIPAVVTPAAPAAAPPAFATSPPASASAAPAPGNMPAGGMRPQASRAAASPSGVQGRRVMAAAVLVALGAVLYLISRRPARPPRLIGAFAGNAPPAAPPSERIGGIGRFARPRSGPPPRLS